jgi:hypothetical protein
VQAHPQTNRSGSTTQRLAPQGVTTNHRGITVNGTTYPWGTNLAAMTPEHRATALQHTGHDGGSAPTFIPQQVRQGIGAQGSAELPTFRPGSQYTASPTFHPSTGRQTSVRVSQDQGFGQRYYGGSYTPNGTYFYDPDGKAVVRDWRS